MDERNELSDIVLNKGGSSNSNKKIILAIAILGVILIIVVMLMNSINSSGTSNLPQAVLPPEPNAQVATENELDKEPIFEDVPVVDESNQDTNMETNLDNIAKKLKKESVTEDTSVVEEPVAQSPKVIRERETVATTKPVKVAPSVKKVATPKATHKGYFIQVGSFSKYTPNKKFLNSITRLGYKYSYHKVNNLNKVLVGPFSTRQEANRAKAILRSKVERGAFLVKL